MCLIIASPHGQKIASKIIKEAAATNRDGGGIAWLDSKINKVRWKKGLDDEEIIAVADGLPDKTPHVVHFRIATVGGVRDELTHPFAINAAASTETEGTADSVLFHNGGESDWKKLVFQACTGSGLKLPKGPWSDSRGVAFCCHVYGPHFLSLIEGHSRYLIFDATVPTEDRMLIWGDWYQYKELKFSNRGTSAFYDPPRTRVIYPATPSAGSHLHTPAQPPAVIPVGTPASRRRIRPFSVKAGFEPWKSFTAEGLSNPVAANEGSKK